ncbi:uncharacterized protein METZ01_LOCUS22408 [marine metagenome]|uniref:Uncharacterized protein n=1 Tax=marine metagenome TaxID=408172 RepID=A0A381PSD3_9ZZZZ
MCEENEYLDNPNNHDEEQDLSGSLVLRARGNY